MRQSRLMLLWLELQCPEVSVTELTDGEQQKRVSAHTSPLHAVTVHSP